jgi:hypothetical protein
MANVMAIIRVWAVPKLPCTHHSKLNDMKFLRLPLDTLMFRYYLMMVVVLVAGFSQTWVIALLALPIFLSCLLGIRFDLRAMRSTATGVSREMHPGGNEESKSAA